MAILLVPEDKPVDPNGKVDWVGAYLGVGALILFNFVWKCVLRPLLLDGQSLTAF